MWKSAMWTSTCTRLGIQNMLGYHCISPSEQWDGRACALCTGKSSMQFVQVALPSILSAVGTTCSAKGGLCCVISRDGNGIPSHPLRPAVACVEPSRCCHASTQPTQPCSILCSGAADSLPAHLVYVRAGSQQNPLDLTRWWPKGPRHFSSRSCRRQR